MKSAKQFGLGISRPAADHFGGGRLQPDAVSLLYVTAVVSSLCDQRDGFSRPKK
jgi:hypothetical protein